MKGKHILFLAIPAMMLASCGGNLGTEVTDSSAINDMLSNVATKSEDVKNFKFVVDINGTAYDEEAKKNVTSIHALSYGYGSYRLRRKHRRAGGRENHD